MRWMAVQVVVVASGVTACSQRTGVLVEITDPAPLTSLQAQVSVNGASPVTRLLSSGGGSPKLPGSFLVVLPDLALDVAIALEGLEVGGRSVVARGLARSVPHRQVTLTLQLAAALDGGTDFAASDLSLCPAVSAFEASPVPGQICLPDNVLAADGRVTGLDRNPQPPEIGTLGGGNVVGCVGVDFGSVAVRDPIVVRAAASGDACGLSPCASVCGTGRTYAVFTGTTMGTYQLLATDVAVTATLADTTFGAGTPFRYVVVCRLPWGPARDDIVVDVIRAACQ